MDVEQCNLAEDFMQQLENHFGLKYDKVLFKEEWSRDPPNAAPGLSLDDYILEACLLSRLLWTIINVA